MPIKPYFPTSPPLRATLVGGANNTGATVPSRPRRISALIIEEDLSDIDTSDSSWFLPATTYETLTISQKGPLPEQSYLPNLDAPTVADTSRRPSICLARLQTQFPDVDSDVNIKLPNYEYSHSPSSLKSNSALAHFKTAEAARTRRGSASEVLFHSPLRRSKTYSHSSMSSSSSSSSGSSFASGYESPVFYADGECDCDDYAVGGERECSISKSACSQPIRVPSNSSNTRRKRRGCFVQDDAAAAPAQEPLHDEEVVMEDNLGSMDDWVQFAYMPSSGFETALISEVVRRRHSDERFAILKSSGSNFEKELENAQFSESHRRSKWMRDMLRWYPQECGGGHMLPCF
ncbi:hypothetical protein DRE_01279 [Drechslerella stenobrocha 248]|uniref:Uncharacterized protein n=1 Tax=Drechslerella stenobrocha 248 TaxID=1043628 RepID=W7HV35_9PEZI|nr:hypothetical protein DRE_01279 [Drechslerella stenobrocha 248]